MSKIKEVTVGAIGYDTHQGLGHLMKSFYDNYVVDKVLVIPHPNYPRHPHFYDREDRFTLRESARFYSSVDVLLLFENAWNQWGSIADFQRRGGKVVLMPMYEWTPYPVPVKPDIMLCPSLLDVDVYHDQYNCHYLPVPVEATFKQRTRAHVWVHNAGHGGHDYREGTPEILEAMKHVRSDIRLIVRCQPQEKRMSQLLRRYSYLPKEDRRVTIIGEEVPSEQLWEQGDVMIAPQKYNGLSLPLQEAFASGLVVMTTDRYPANVWLPHDPLIPYRDERQCKLGGVPFNSCVIDPKDIAKKIDEFYGKDISQLSAKGCMYNVDHSWEVLRPKYLSLIKG